MADLQVPEVLFLRPSAKAATSPSVNPIQTRGEHRSTSGVSSTRSVREVLEDLRRAQRTNDSAEIRDEVAGGATSYSVDQPVQEVQGPHFRGSLIREEQANGSAPNSNAAVPLSGGLCWPPMVLELARRHQIQFDAIFQKTASRSRIGIVGLEPHCGTTTIASAMSLHHCDRINRRPLNQRSETILIDANLAKPMIASFINSSQATSWQEWTTISIDGLIRNPNPIASLQLPGENGLRLWPLACGIYAAGAPITTPDVTFKSESATVRYYLPVQAAGPVAQTLGRVVDHLAGLGSIVMADLGHLEHWRRLQHLTTVAKSFDQIILVLPASADRRQVSKAIWELQDVGQSSCLMIENSQY